ncbi:MAG: hypothetical protein ACP5KE_05975 [Candidatus Methanodesulfokora sp.]
MSKDKEVIKVELPGPLAERFRRYVADRYGQKRGSLSKAVADLIERAVGPPEESGVDAIVGLGLKSNYQWRGEDLVEALKELHAGSGCKHRARGSIQKE